MNEQALTDRIDELKDDAICGSPYHAAIDLLTVANVNCEGDHYGTAIAALEIAALDESGNAGEIIGLVLKRHKLRQEKTAALN